MYGVEILDNPGFYVTYALVQAALLLLLIRLLDPYKRGPLAGLALVALWGATGAAAISLAGNEAVKGLLSGDARLVFGNAIAPPLVEECAKGVAVVLAALASRWASRRLGTPPFEGVSDGIIYGAAVGLGFAFTEDFFYFVDRAGTEGLDAASDLFVSRRDFFGPAALHHPLFTAAFGAGVGLATWTVRRWARYAWPLAGLAVAILMHAVNNGLNELMLTIRYGLATTAAWVRDEQVPVGVEDTADTANAVLALVDYLYIVGFIVAVVVWQARQRRIVAMELDEEVDAGVISREERDTVSQSGERSKLYWSLLRTGQLGRWRQVRRLHWELASLALLKSRVRRFGGDRSRIRHARRRIVSLQTSAAQGGDLPAQANRIVGREREIAEALSLIERRDVRLVTLTGPGGTGKTRLALELASECSDRFPSGAYFVPLAAVRDRERVGSAIAQVLEVPELAGDEPLARVEDYLRDKQLLLVLDNFEQVQAAAPDVSRLLAAASRVTVLATSRTPLNIAGEQEYRVPPLAVPDAVDDDAALSGSPAVALFTERARAVDPTAGQRDGDLAAIAEICRRLDGLPLAIELAAARVKVLPPAAILARLGSSLEVLTGGRADLPERQQTVRAAIRWSEELLEPERRKLFRRLGIFPGGCRQDAVESVCADEGDSESTILDGLTDLVESSLVRREVDADGEPRFSMLTTIRAYALERLSEEREAEAVGERQADYCLRLAESAEPELEGEDQAAWTRRLAEEHENLLAALGWYAAAGRVESGLRLAAALGSYWERGRLHDGRTSLLRALGAAETETVPRPARARARYVAGRLSLLQGDYAQARGLLGAALDDFRRDGDRRAAIRSLWDLGWIELFSGDYARAEGIFEEALGDAREVDDSSSVARALASLGRAAAEQGDFERASRSLNESLELRRQLRDERGEASSLSGLGRVALLEGRLDAAVERLEEALGHARRLDDKLRAAEALNALVLAKIERDELDEAATLARERLSLCRELGDKLGIAECAEALAAVAAGQADELRAAQLSGFAENVRGSIGVPRWRLDEQRFSSMLGRVRAGLADRFEPARAEGARMTLDQGVRYALSLESAASTGVRKTADAAL